MALMGRTFNSHLISGTENNFETLETAAIFSQNLYFIHLAEHRVIIIVGFVTRFNKIIQI